MYGSIVMPSMSAFQTVEYTMPKRMTLGAIFIEVGQVRVVVLVVAVLAAGAAWNPGEPVGRS